MKNTAIRGESVLFFVRYDSHALNLDQHLWIGKLHATDEGARRTVREPFVAGSPVRLPSARIRHIGCQAHDVFQGTAQAFQRGLHVLIGVIELLGHSGATDGLRFRVFAVFPCEENKISADARF